MKKINRRDFLKYSAGSVVAASSASLMPAAAQAGQTATASGYKPLLPIEDGAEIKFLRWSGYVKSDEALWNKNTQAFTEATGVPVKIQYLNWNKMAAKSALAAQLNVGPDAIMGWKDTPFLFPDKLADVSDVVEYLGKKYGGWYDIAHTYGYSQDQKRWIAVPFGDTGTAMTYRQSWMQEAGHDEFPTDMDSFLDLCRKLKKNGHPIGLTLGHAEGDAEWTLWALWAFGGKTVDKENRVAIDSRETREALKYAKALHETMIPGVASWMGTNNNRALLSGDISVTMNGISIWYVAQEQFQEIADDVRTATFPMGPGVDKPTGPAHFTEAFVFKFAKYPNAAKEYLRFMLEREQAAPWVTAMKGYVTPALKTYTDLPVWTSNPNITPYRDQIKGARFHGWAGSPGGEAARAMHDFIVLDMFAQVCIKDTSPADAARRAAQRLKAIYG